MKKTRKIILLLLLITTLSLSLLACGLGKVKIEDYNWEMRCVMHVEDGKSVVDATAQEDSAHPDAKVIEMTLVAKDGKITVTDVTNNKTYEGTYTLDSKTPDGTNYKVTIDGKTGYAGVAMTTYADGTQEPTLPITLDGYSMYFYAD